MCACVRVTVVTAIARLECDILFKRLDWLKMMKCWKTCTKTLSHADLMSGLVLFLCSSLRLLLSRLFLARCAVQVSGLSEGRAPFCTPLQAVYRSRSILFFPRSVDRIYEFHVSKKKEGSFYLFLSLRNHSGVKYKFSSSDWWILRLQEVEAGPDPWPLKTRSERGFSTELRLCWAQMFPSVNAKWLSGVKIGTVTV